MRKTPFSSRSLFWSAAALLAVATLGLPQAHAASHSANLELLTGQLPAGVTPATAKMKDLDSAVRTASHQRPKDAGDFVSIAIRAKKPKRSLTPCDIVRQIVEAAVHGAPEQSREIVEVAESLNPECASELNAVLNAFRRGNNDDTTGATNVATDPNADENGSNDGFGPGGFGAGFGPGFPGSPGFSGSSASGGFALPPVVTPRVTSEVNS